MENEKSHREKAIAALSVGLLAVAVFFTFIAAVGTIFMKVHFGPAIKTMIIPDELPAITELLVLSISSVTYGIFFASLILVLILKELFVHARRVTLAINSVIVIAAIAYYCIYTIALYLPVAANN